MSEALTVSQFVQVVDEGLAAFDGIQVKGEVAEFKIIHNKWVTFKIKDERSAIGCFMTVWQYKTEVEDGMMVLAKGRPRLRDKGFFSFVLESVRPVGEGSLKKALEKLQKKLAQEGLFDKQRKRQLPRFPQHVALITSRDAAAYSDFLKILQARAGGLTISFISSQVQGEDAPRQLLAALETANTRLRELDAVIMVRGGGSLEDLMAFNDEQVIRAVAASRVPMIVGVGHERDVTLAELAADVRASTPSNAAELLVRSREEMAIELEQVKSRLKQQITDQLVDARALMNRIMDILRGQVRAMDRDLAQLTRILKSLSPEKILARGYSISRRADGKILTSAEQVNTGDELVTQLRDGSINSQVK